MGAGVDALTVRNIDRRARDSSKAGIHGDRHPARIHDCASSIPVRMDDRTYRHLRSPATAATMLEAWGSPSADLLTAYWTC